MLRKFLCALLAVGVVTVGLLAEEVRGKIKSVDADKGKITITTKDGDKEFTVADDTKFVAGRGKKLNDLPDKIKAKVVKEGATVTIVTEKKGDKDVVTEVRVQSGGKKE